MGSVGVGVGIGVGGVVEARGGILAVSSGVLGDAMVRVSVVLGSWIDGIGIKILEVGCDGITHFPCDSGSLLLGRPNVIASMLLFDEDSGTGAPMFGGQVMNHERMRGDC